jgi:DUF4097 and DUF4098 domain-containing protein YvlB
MVTPGENEISLKGHNGNVSVRGYNGDKITVRVSSKPARAGAAVRLTKVGPRYLLDYDEDAFHSVALDAFIPESMFRQIHISTVNGLLEVSNLRSENARLATTNNEIRLQQVDVANLELSTANHGLTVKDVTFLAYPEYVWALDTANARISAQLPTGPGYHIRARSTLGRVQVALRGLNILSSDAYNMEARSADYATAVPRVRIALETSNGDIQVY